ncbi:hypothetical protein BGW80DRAFT_501089 [Lactifluus volemus]|nr:hypothetical protein BGW80DRAFT_501089 [Lactifluus volemus]
MKEILDGQVEMRERHRTDMLRIGSEAKDAQVQLDGLFDVLSRFGARNGDKKRSSFGKIRPFRRRPRMNALLRDTGQPPPLLELNLDPPLATRRAFFDPTSRFSSTRRLANLPTTLELGQISAWFEDISDAAQVQRVAMEDLLERMCQLESERAQEVESSECERRRLEDELAETGEQLHLAHEDVLRLCQELDREKEARGEAEAHAHAIERELDACREELQEVQGARHSEQIEELRLRSAEVESS